MTLSSRVTMADTPLWCRCRLFLSVERGGAHLLEFASLCALSDSDPVIGRKTKINNESDEFNGDERNARCSILLSPAAWWLMKLLRCFCSGCRDCPKLKSSETGEWVQKMNEARIIESASWNETTYKQTHVEFTCWNSHVEFPCWIPIFEFQCWIPMRNSASRLGTCEIQVCEFTCEYLHVPDIHMDRAVPAVTLGSVGSGSALETEQVAKPKSWYMWRMLSYPMFVYIEPTIIRVLSVFLRTYGSMQKLCLKKITHYT